MRTITLAITVFTSLPGLAIAQDEIYFTGPHYNVPPLRLERRVANKTIWRKYFYGPGAWSNPMVDRKGNALLDAKGWIWKIGPKGNLLWRYPSDGSGEVAIDKDGNIFRTTQGDNHKRGGAIVKLVKISPLGRTQWVKWRTVGKDPRDLVFLDSLQLKGQMITLGIWPNDQIIQLDSAGRVVGQTKGARKFYRLTGERKVRSPQGGVIEIIPPVGNSPFLYITTGIF